jgi:putative membrane protein
MTKLKNLTVFMALAATAVSPIWAAETTQIEAQSGTSQGAGAAAGMTANGTQTATGTEAQILSEIHEANQSEIQLGQLAQQKAQRSDVRDFGHHLVTDHTQADARVSQIAGSQSVQLQSAGGADAKQQAGLNKLQALSGREFDRAFLRQIHAAHQDTIVKLEGAQGQLSANSSVRQLVAELLPKLRQHRDNAATLMQTASARKSGLGSSQSQSMGQSGTMNSAPSATGGATGATDQSGSMGQPNQTGSTGQTGQTPHQ